MRTPTTTCNRCGSVTVRWATSRKTGKPYLQNIAHWYGENGVQREYPRGPHFLTCEEEAARRDERLAEMREATVTRIAAEASIRFANRLRLLVTQPDPEALREAFARVDSAAREMALARYDAAP